MKKIAFLIIFISLTAFGAEIKDVHPLIKEFSEINQISNMQVGIVNQKDSMVFSIGDKKHYPINSMSKSFAALLLADQVSQHYLKLNDQVKDFFPVLTNRPIGHVTLLNLATHTSGLPLSTDSDVNTQAGAMKYLRTWYPSYPADTRRVYSNLGIGLLGYVIEESTQKSYTDNIHQNILNPYGMHQTDVNPIDFHFFKDTSIFLAPDGIISTAGDMNRFMKLMMKMNIKDKETRKAIDLVLSDYYQTPYFIQSLSWQKFPWPVSRSMLLASGSMDTLNTKAIPIKKPVAHYDRAFLYTRTGAGYEYCSIMAMIPKQQVSIVVLIDKPVRMEDRLDLVYTLFKKLGL